jgi:hypothetical protein
LWEVLPQIGDGLAIDFYGTDGARLLEEELREDAHARTDFENGYVWTGIDGIGDAASYGKVSQEVLAKLFLRLYLLHGSES